MNINETITFDDLLLVPQYSEILSRKSIDLSSELDMNRKFDLPIVSSPMDTVTGATMATAISKAGGLGVIHRYDSIDGQCDRIRRTNGTKAAAIGVTGDYLDRATALIKSGCDILCIDVAHGHHALMRHALKTLRNTIGYGIHIMAGNVATLEGFNDLADWGANSIRVGIGGGSICSTRIQTGHGVPTLQSVMDCSLSDRSAALIADGGDRMPLSTQTRSTDAGRPTRATNDGAIFADAKLTVMTSRNINVMEINYQDIYPKSLSALEYNQNLTDVEYLTASCTFGYKIHTYTTL